MAAMSRSSNSDIWKAPPSMRPRIAGARSAVIQSSPAGLMSSAMRASGGAERRDDMAVRQRTDDADRLPIARNDRAALEERFEAGDALRRPVGKVEQRALPHLAALAIALAQQDRRRGVAVRDRLDVHGAMIEHSTIQHRLKPLSYMATHWAGQSSLPPKYQSLNVDERGKLRLGLSTGTREHRRIAITCKRRPPSHAGVRPQAGFSRNPTIRRRWGGKPA